MIIKNVYEVKREKVTGCHEGKGTVLYCSIFRDETFDTNCHFIDWLFVPKGTSIGIHPHLNEEEIYFICKGEGIMTVNDEEKEVKKGDVVVAKAGDTHGLRNEKDENIELFVFQVGHKK